MKNRFQPNKFHQHTIVTNSGTVVGHVRIKPSGILWASKGAKVWRGLSIKAFDNLMEEHGRPQDK
jgi:hypothetical protein